MYAIPRHKFWFEIKHWITCFDISEFFCIFSGHFQCLTNWSLWTWWNEWYTNRRSFCILARQKSLTRFQAKGKGKHLDTNLLGKDTLSYVPFGTSNRILDLMVTNGVTHLNHSVTKFLSFYFFVSHTKRKWKKKKEKRKTGNGSIRLPLAF